MKRAVRPRKVKPSQVVAIGLSGQMHSSVFLDGGNKVIRPALLWCDGRTTVQCRAIAARVDERRCAAGSRTRRWKGSRCRRSSGCATNEPAAFARLAKVLLPKDYIRFSYRQLATEYSDAAAR